MTMFFSSFIVFIPFFYNAGIEPPAVGCNINLPTCSGSAPTKGYDMINVRSGLEILYPGSHELQILHGIYRKGHFLVLARLQQKNKYHSSRIDDANCQILLSEQVSLTYRLCLNTILELARAFYRALFHHIKLILSR